MAGTMHRIKSVCIYYLVNWWISLVCAFPEKSLDFWEEDLKKQIEVTSYGWPENRKLSFNIETEAFQPQVSS